VIEFIIIVIAFLAGLIIGSAVTVSFVAEKLKPVRDTLQKIKSDLESGKIKVNK
jgi:uncharacterized membrane-anchored protein YhcB (DUF1043 family)